MPQKISPPAAPVGALSAMTAVELGLMSIPGFARLRGDRREAAARDILQRLDDAGHLSAPPQAEPEAAAAA